jgi:hypothetical protein
MSEDNQSETLQAIDFSTFVLSLSTNALVHMGEVEDSSAADIPVDMVMAKQTIDIIGMLKDKTKNNLTPEEENLINHVLYDLRLRFVQHGKK